MAEPFIGEIRMVAFPYAPRNWAQCNGQMIDPRQNAALASLIGDIYGGDMRTTVGLPDLRGRVPVHRGPEISIGESSGAENIKLSISQMPAHLHAMNGTTLDADASDPTDRLAADSQAMSVEAYGPDKNLIPLNMATVSTVGSQGYHSNIQPSACVLFCIALQGVYPPRQ